MLSLDYSPFLLLVCAAAAAGLTYAAYRVTVPALSPGRKGLLAGLRCSSLFLVLLLIFGPVLQRTEARNEAPILAVLVDHTLSLTTGDREGAAQLLDAVRSLPAGARHFVFAGGTRAFDRDTLDRLDFSGERTDITQALETAVRDLEGRNLRGVVLISDGRYNTGRNPVHTAEQFPVPIYTVAVGDTMPQIDVVLARVVTNEIAYTGVELPVRIAVRSTGYAGRQAGITLTEEGRRVASGTVTLPPDGGEAFVDLAFVPNTPGLRRLTAQVEGQPGEITLQNNVRSTTVQVLDSRRRVLLLGAAPGPDVAAALRALASDENLDIQTAIQRTPGTFYESPPDLNLRGYDAIVMAGYPGAGADDATAARVAAAIAAGTPAFFILTRQTDLAKLSRHFDEALPASPEQVRNSFTPATAAVTSIGLTHPVFQLETGQPSDVARLPAIEVNDSRWRIAPGAQVLATATVRGADLGQPVVVVGRGIGRRSAALLAAGSWRWGNLPTDLEAYGGLYEGLLANVLRWVTTREDRRLVRVQPTDDSYGADEAVGFSGQVYDERLAPISDAEVAVRLRAPDGTETPYLMQPLGSGRYTLSVGRLPAGDYRFVALAGRAGVELGTDNGVFRVGELLLEYQDIGADPEIMRQIALRSGGWVVPLDEVGSLQQQIEREGRFRPQVVERRRERPLWHLGWLLIPIIGLLTTEWVLRKRSGMV
ncbi:hypothetical protein BH23BAC4_BH23BAC4_14350 [soil metagenome]